ncbi:MAG: hypothetical protein JW883_02975, partial [Deltaproteobacteria bacterium]|nr:hypothetical protein [Deltaproteobacteria bacterium]
LSGKFWQRKERVHVAIQGKKYYSSSFTTASNLQAIVQGFSFFLASYLASRMSISCNHVEA